MARETGRGRHAGHDPRRFRWKRAHAVGTDVDPVRLEIFNNLFMAIAEEMGVALQSTALPSTSRNVSISAAPSSMRRAR
jgi:hypothetical protein